MAHVFVSYSRNDAQLVQRLIASLDSVGFTVWTDRKEIRSGTHWPTEIVDAIEAAAAVLVALSPSSMESENVRKELAIAVDAKKLILPVWIERTTLSKGFKYHLADIQQIDLATDFQAGIGELRNALEPIFKGTLDSIINDPRLTTREKIDAYIKVYTAHKDPIEARIEEKIRELDSTIASHGVQIEALEQERKGLHDRGAKPSNKVRQRVEKELRDLERKKFDLERERRELQMERIELHMKYYEKLIKTADNLHERYGRLVDEILKKGES